MFREDVLPEQDSDEYSRYFNNNRKTINHNNSDIKDRYNAQIKDFSFGGEKSLQQSPEIAIDDQNLLTLGQLSEIEKVEEF